jgi:sugar lactone lactonase YvrE
LADLSARIAHQTNDMVMDAEGRAYIGNFGVDWVGEEKPRPTVLTRVDPDGQIHVATEDLYFPNGAVITPDGRTMVVAETFAYRLTAFDKQADGELTNRRVFAELGALQPDGICLDAEGCIWVTCPGAQKIVRVREGGEVTQEIPLPERESFACMLGGEDRRDLFICTATGFNPSETMAQRAGRIERVRADVPGAGLP